MISISEMEPQEIKLQRGVLSAMENQGSSGRSHASHSSKTHLAGKENIDGKRKTHGKENANTIKPFLKEKRIFLGEKKRNLKIFEETTQCLKKSKAISTQTTLIEEEATSLMYNETPTERYWELLAEERRKALHAALEENKQLADEVEQKDEIIKDMKEHMEVLEEKAAHGRYLASIIEDITKASSENITESGDTSRIGNKSLNTTDGNDQSPGNSPHLSDGTCSHDSDKENKPELAPPYKSDSSDYN